MPKRVTNEETPDTPRLINRSILDRESGCTRAFIDFVEVVYFNGEVRNLGARATLRRDRELRGSAAFRRERQNPTHVHGNVHAQHISVEGMSRIKLLTGYIRNDSPDHHGCSPDQICHWL